MDTRIIITEKLKQLPYKYDASKIAQILDCTAEHQIHWLDDLIDRGATIGLSTLPHLFLLIHLFSFADDAFNARDTVHRTNAQVTAILSTLFTFASSRSFDEITSELSADYLSQQKTGGHYISLLRIHLAELCADIIFGNQKLMPQTKIKFIDHLILQPFFYKTGFSYYVGSFFSSEPSAVLILKKAKADLERQLACLPDETKNVSSRLQNT